MGSILVKETHGLLTRQGVTPSQKYYAIAFLNRAAVIRGGHDPDLRLALFQSYFHLFRETLKNPEERRELVFKKDRTKSKKEQIKEKKKIALKVK